VYEDDGLLPKDDSSHLPDAHSLCESRKSFVDGSRGGLPTTRGQVGLVFLKHGPPIERETRHWRPFFDGPLSASHSLCRFMADGGLSSLSLAAASAAARAAAGGGAPFAMLENC